MRMNLKQLNALAKMWITDPDGATSLLAFRRKCEPLPYQIVDGSDCTYCLHWKKVFWCIAPSGLIH